MSDPGDGTRATLFDVGPPLDPPAVAPRPPPSPRRLLPVDTSIHLGHPCLVCGQKFEEFHWFHGPLDDWDDPEAPDVVVGLNGPSFKVPILLGRWCECGAVQTVEQPPDRDEWVLVEAMLTVTSLMLANSHPVYPPTEYLPEGVTFTPEQIARRTIGAFGG